MQKFYFLLDKPDTHLKINEVIATKTKKHPNNFLSKSPSNEDAKYELAAQEITDGMSKSATPLFSTRPFLICTVKDAEPDGKNAMRFANCAVSCSTCITSTKIGKVSVPPPIPMPARMPPSKPAKTKNINCIITSFLTKTLFYLAFLQK